MRSLVVRNKPRKSHHRWNREDSFGLVARDDVTLSSTLQREPLRGRFGRKIEVIRVNRSTRSVCSCPIRREATLAKHFIWTYTCIMWFRTSLHWLEEEYDSGENFDGSVNVSFTTEWDLSVRAFSGPICSFNLNTNFRSLFAISEPIRPFSLLFSYAWWAVGSAP